MEPIAGTIAGTSRYALLSTPRVRCVARVPPSVRHGECARVLLRASLSATHVLHCAYHQTYRLVRQNAKPRGALVVEV
jgi:hypothetical protein